MNDLLKQPFLITFILINVFYSVLMNLYYFLIGTESFLIDFNGIYSSIEYSNVAKYNWIGFSIYLLLENIAFISISSYIVYLIVRRRKYFIKFFELAVYIELFTTILTILWDYLAFEDFNLNEYKVGLFLTAFTIILVVPYIKKSPEVKELFTN